MSFIQANKIKLYYETLGEGPALLLIAGLACDHSMWNEIKESFAKDFTVISFDNREIGQSEITSKPFTIEDLAKDAAALLDALHISQANIVGHSMGASIAMSLALDHPKKVKKLALCCGASRFSEDVKDTFYHQVKLLESNTAIDVCLDNILPWLFSKDYLAQAGNIEKEKKRILENPFPQSLESYAAQVRALDKFDLSNQIYRIENKTLILAAEKDWIVPLEEEREMATQIENSKLVILPKVGHCAMLEAPDIFTDEILKFNK